MIIEVPLCFRHSKPAGKDRRGESFCAGFAVASGNCDHAALSAVIAASCWLCLQCVFCANEREIFRRRT